MVEVEEEEAEGEVEEEKRKTKTVQNILESQVYIFSFVLSFDFCEKTGYRLEAQLKGWKSKSQREHPNLDYGEQ